MSDLNERALRNAFGCFASGVTIVSCHGEDGVHGMTANSFVSVSLHPALALISVRRQARMHGLLSAAQHFGLSVLEASQEIHSRHFAGQPQQGLLPRFHDQHGAPVLAGALAWLVCAPHASMDIEDHTLFIGRVLNFDYNEHAAPLVYFSGRYERLHTPAAHFQEHTLMGISS